MAPDSSGNEQQHKGNNRTIYTTSAAKRDGKDSQVWVSRALQDRGEYWTSSESQEVALKAAGSSSWHWDTAALPQTLPCYRNCLAPADVHRRTGRAKQICVSYRHTHFYPIKHLLLQFISTRNSWAATECKGINPCPALPQPRPSHPSKGSHALHILYSAELGVLSRFLQTKKQGRSEVFTLQEVLHLHWKHILSFGIKAAGEVPNWVSL